MTDKKQCSTMVSGKGPWGAFHQHKCRRPATVLRDDMWYCKIHDPEYIENKRVAEEAEWDRKRAEDELKWQRAKAIQKATDGLTTKELRQVTPELIRNALRAGLPANKEE